MNQVDNASENYKKSSSYETEEKYSETSSQDLEENALAETIEVASAEQMNIYAAGDESGYEPVAVDAVIERFTWWETGGKKFQVGIMVDGLAVMMLFVVTVISLLVHIYSTNHRRLGTRWRVFVCVNRPLVGRKTKLRCCSKGIFN